MGTRVQKWGNSLVVRTPKSFAAETRLDQDPVVELSLGDGNLLISPIAPARERLEQLLAGVTEDNRHGEWNTGDAVGGEVW